jgi:hypothetical protein
MNEFLEEWRNIIEEASIMRLNLVNNKFHWIFHVFFFHGLVSFQFNETYQI